MLENQLQDKIFKGLVIGLSVLAAGILLKELVLQPRVAPLSPPPAYVLKVELDFELLKSQELKGLLPFEKITLPKDFGRDEPFEPY